MAKKGHVKWDCKTPKRQQDNKYHAIKDFINVSDEDASDALILTLDTCSESWVIDLGMLFHASHKE